MTIHRRFWIAGFAAILCPAILSLPSTAKYRPPSTLQLPGGRQGAATRSGCEIDGDTFEPVLPTSNYGQTTAAYPTVYWYQNNHQFSWARFELFATQAKKLDSIPLYSSTFRLGQAPSLVSLSLPSQSGLPPLEVGRDYLWRVTLICSQKGPEDRTAVGSPPFIEGWITRVEPSPTLRSQLSDTAQKYEVYAEQGLWYDAISDLVNRRRQQSQDPQLKKDWQDLMLMRNNLLSPAISSAVF